MLYHQHTHVCAFSRPILRSDFISLLPKRGLDHVAENILSYLDAKSLCDAELVCKEWHQVISEGMLWKKLIEKCVRTDSVWRGLMEQQGSVNYLFKPSHIEPHADHIFYRRLYPKIMQDIQNIETNWQRIGSRIPKRINGESEDSEGPCCMQYDDHKIVSGLYDSTIKIWDRKTLECIQVLTGHTKPVMCLQFDDRVIISGSSDSTIRVWDVKTGEVINILLLHGEPVSHLRFNNGTMVTCSTQRFIAVWNMVSPSEITLQRAFVGHKYLVSAVDFDEKYIVSASRLRINVWNISTCELARTLQGHERGVLCLQYRNRLVVSGSRDKTIKLWDAESGACLRTLEGHIDFVSCIKFDDKRIVSGDDFGAIIVWDLAAALDPRAPAKTLCTGLSSFLSTSVCSLQFDDFQMVSCTDIGTIWIWDFINYSPPVTHLLWTYGRCRNI